MCLQVYQLISSFSYCNKRLAWQAAFKKTKIELELLREIEMLLMLEKGVRSGVEYIMLFIDM